MPDKPASETPVTPSAEFKDLPPDLQRLAEETQKIENELFKPPVEDNPAEIPKPEDKSAGIKPGEVKPEDKPVDQPAPKEDDFKHKYDVLQGKYNKEVPRLSDRLDLVENENVRLRQELLNRAEQPKPQVKEEVVVKPTKTVDQILLEIESAPEVAYIKTEFPDVLKGMKFIVKEAMAAGQSVDIQEQIKNIRNEVSEIKSTTVKTSRQIFIDYLDKNVQGWRQVNKDQRFKEWLSQPDRYTGLPKLDLINRANESLDGPTAANFFVDFAKENEPPKEEKPKEVVPIKEETKKIDVVPPVGVQTPVPKKPDSENQNTITATYISKFYQDQLDGKWRGRETEALAEEKRIEKATQEGRVTF